MKVLVTGAAGFIGSFVSKKLLETGNEVVGLDNLNDYYDPSIKTARLEMFSGSDSFRFIKADICDGADLDALFEREKFDSVVHLAAQAGVRYSIENPAAYVRSNVEGFLNILESCRHHPVSHLVYASSSSVYGGNEKIPFSEEDPVDNPVSLYAATKKSDELMAACYSHLFGIKATGLRFFTVYGPMGRPDMAPLIFTRAIIEGTPIKVFNNGDMSRDFTYIDDIVEGVVRVLANPPAYSEKRGNSHEVYNIGCSNPVKLMDFIHELERATGRKAVIEYCPMQKGDVPRTFADTSRIESRLGYKPSVSIRDGVGLLVDWYKNR